MDPFPEKTDWQMKVATALEDFDNLKDKEVVLVGRVRSTRPMGGSTFSHIEDESGKIQLFLNKKNISEELYKLFVKNTEIGDFVEARGKLFLTKAGEKSLEVSDWKMLSKSVRPIPTEHFGMKDEEELLRKRYLDLMLNPETREIFRKKNIFWQTIRNFLTEKGFLEVQTPVLEHIPGGAEAEPFITHHNALDQDFYLRISLELPLKRLLVGGYEKVFEIGRCFRNEGMDRSHLQEFDNVEFYEAYSDLEKGIAMVEKLYQEIVLKVTGGMETEYEGQKINWGGKWERVDYFEAFKKETGIDLGEDLSLEALRAKADELGIKYEKSYGLGRMIDTIYKKTVRAKIVQPCFLVGHPLLVSPLAKIDPKNPKKVLRMQPMAAGAELGNGFAELNDPVEQKRRFDEQAKLREAGDKEAQMIDEDFVEALEYGMPPAFGFGMGERFFAFIMNKSVRETVIFPAVRGKEENSSGKSKETKIAVVVLNNEAKMKNWEELNTVAHLNASFASRAGEKLLMQDEISTKDGEKLKLNIQHAIMIKEASSSEGVKKLIREAKEKELEVVEFTREMITTTDDKKVIEETKQKDFKDVEYLGVLVFGKKSSVEKLTDKFELHR